jgi:hypothetical protein
MARKQPTAAKAPESSASSSASELAMHFQKAEAYQIRTCFIKESHTNIKLKLQKGNRPNSGTILVHTAPSLHQIYQQWFQV